MNTGTRIYTTSKERIEVLPMFFSGRLFNLIVIRSLQVYDDERSRSCNHVSCLFTGSDVTN